MVHFHLHTNGTHEEEDASGHSMRVPRWVVLSAWVGLAVLFWCTAILFVVEAVKVLRHL